MVVNRHPHSPLSKEQSRTSELIGIVHRIDPQGLHVSLRETRRLKPHQCDMSRKSEVSIDEVDQAFKALVGHLVNHNSDFDWDTKATHVLEPDHRVPECSPSLNDVIMFIVQMGVERHAKHHIRMLNA